MKHWIIIVPAVACCMASQALPTSITAPAAPAAASRCAWSEVTPSHCIRVANGTIEVVFAAGKMRLSRADVLEWVEDSARAVADYHGRFPVDYLHLSITPVVGRGVPDGAAYGYDGAFIRLGVGRDSTARDLASDWVLVHEMVHLAFPSLDDRHSWLKEGLATYVEPLARYQAGLTTREEVWRWLIDGLPHGLPEFGDRGLDYTPTWGRTYWGGALFCLLADVEIRRRTNNERGLQDALQAVNQAGGDITDYWSIDRALEIADEAVGAPVLTHLYEAMRAVPHGVDLEDLWRRLGVRANGAHIAFEDDAPLADIRRAITGVPARQADPG